MIPPATWPSTVWPNPSRRATMFLEDGKEKTVVIRSQTGGRR